MGNVSWPLSHRRLHVKRLTAAVKLGGSEYQHLA